MYRVEEVAYIINEIKVNSLLDVGCRDCILKKHISDDIEYSGNDLFQNEYNSVRYIGDILNIEIPLKSFDCVTALDILEHTDDPYTIFNKLDTISSKYLIINLPNCYDLKSMWKFVIKGHLGGKYKFDVRNQMDRHRWLMNYKEIERFYQFKAKEKGYNLTLVPLYYGSEKVTFTAVIGRFLTYLLPKRMITSSVVGIFEKK